MSFIAARAAAATVERHARVRAPPESISTILPVYRWRSARFEPDGPGTPSATNVTMSAIATP